MLSIVLVIFNTHTHSLFAEQQNLKTTVPNQVKVNDIFEVNATVAPVNPLSPCGPWGPCGPVAPAENCLLNEVQFWLTWLFCY